MYDLNVHFVHVIKAVIALAIREHSCINSVDDIVCKCMHICWHYTIASAIHGYSRYISAGLGLLLVP